MDRNHPLLSLLPRRVFSIEAHTYHNINLLSCAFPDLARFIPLNVELVFTEMWPRMPPLPTTTKILKSWFTIHFTDDGKVGWVWKVALIQSHHKFLTALEEHVVAWPSGLRRCVQVAVSSGGVGSNPTAAISGFRLTRYVLHTYLIHCIEIVGPISIFRYQEQSGAAEACWAHNPEVDGSKPSSAISIAKTCILDWSTYLPQH